MDNYKNKNNLNNEEKKNYQTASLEKKVEETEKGNRTEIFSEPKKRKEWGNRKSESRQLQSEILKTGKPVKVTKGGRRFSFTRLVLIKDESSKAVAYAYSGAKQAMFAFGKAIRKAQKKLTTYFPIPPRTIPRDIVVDYKATRLVLKPTPPGNGIKASKELSTLFKYLGIKDVSVKIIGSSNKLNVIRAVFLALDELTGKKYDY